MEARDGSEQIGDGMDLSVAHRVPESCTSASARVTGAEDFADWISSHKRLAWREVYLTRKRQMKHQAGGREICRLPAHLKLDVLTFRVLLQQDRHALARRFQSFRAAKGNQNRGDIAGG